MCRRTCLNVRRASRCRAAIRSPRRSPGKRSSRSPFDGATEESGRGVRAIVDGVEARLGSAEFCGIDAARRAATHDATASLIGFRHGDRHAACSPSARRCARTPSRSCASSRRSASNLRSCPATAPKPLHRSRPRSASRPGIAGLKPAEKIAFIERMKAQGRRVLMVGDGLNDAPALAAAHASISPISAAHMTQAQADAVFMGERLQPVLDAITDCAPRPPPDAAKPVAGGGLQRHCGPDRRGRAW